jgi:hypothetical protein
MKHITIDQWGKDHWSTIGYLGTLATDHKGVATPDITRMRTNQETHPNIGNPMDGGKYPTKLKKDGFVSGHDGWDCIEDAIREGLLIDMGEAHRQYRFTDYGIKVFNALIKYKIAGSTFQSFVIPENIVKER